MSLTEKPNTRRLLVALGLMILLVAAAACSGEPEPSDELPASTQPPTADAVFAEGRVVPVAESTLAFPFDGQIAAIPVAEGDRVAAGEVLASLTAAEQEAALAEAQAGVAQAEANVAAAEADLEAAQAGVLAATEGVAAARAARAVLVAPPSSERLDVADSAVAAAAAAIEEAAGERDQVVDAATEAELAAARARLQAAETNLFAVRIQNEHIVQDPDEPDDERERAQLRLNAAIAGVNAAQVALDRLEQGVTASERQAAAGGVGRAAAERDAAAAEKALLEAGPVPESVAVADAQIAGAEDRLAAAEAQVAVATTALSRAKAELAAAEAARAAAASALDQTVLEAPFAGTVAEVHVVSGEAVAGGQPAVTLADFGQWQVETTDLTELQVGDFADGAAVTVVVDGLPGEQLRGEVVTIAPTAEVVRGDVTYRATIALPGRVRALPLRWGMTALVAPAASAETLEPGASAFATSAIAATVAPQADASLGFPRGGTVAEIAVAEGEAVAAGTLLLRLEADAQENALRRAEAELVAAEAAYQVALGGVSEAETAVTVAQGEVAVAQARLAQVKAGPADEAVAAAESRLAAAQSAVAGAVGARDTLLQQPGITARVEEARGELATALAELRELEEQYDQIIDTCYDTPDGEVCPLYGPVEETTRAQVQAARARVDAAEAAVADLEGGPTAAQLRAASGRVGAAAANRDLAAAQLALLRAGANEEQIRQAEVGVAVAQAQVGVAEAKVARAQATVAQAEAGVQAAQAGVARAQAALAQATVRAPFAGEIAAVEVDPGELVGAGQPVVLLAAGPWLVETTELTELDVAQVTPGDGVEVRFDALPQVTLSGTVERIALVPQTRNGDVVYTARIQLDGAEELPLRWGMSADVTFPENG